MENSHSTSYKKDLDKLEFGGNKFMALKLMKGSLQYKNQGLTSNLVTLL